MSLRLALAACALAAAAAPASAADSPEDAPLLTLEEAVARARAGNDRLAAISTEVGRAGEREAALRTRRLPGLRVDALGSRLLEPLDFTFAAGTFGVFPQIGPVPPTSTTVSTPADFTLSFVATASQPLTQQVKIGLGLEAVRLEREAATEEVRRERHRLESDVRAAYYALSATEAGVTALHDLVRAVEEVDALTTRYLAEGLALHPDALEVKARLARERQRLQAAESGLATRREALNQLLGRALDAPVRVAPPSTLAPQVAGVTLEEARARAAARRPEVRGARLQGARAETAVKLARAEWLPDLTLTASYARLVHFHVLPSEVASVGLYLSWEVLDWGRRGHEAAERELQVEAASRARSEAESQVALEVGQRWRALRDAGALLDADGLAVDAAEAQLALTRNRYREDARVLRDLLQAEAQLSAARHDHTEALAGYWSAAAELERAIGDDDA